jgi:alpha-1,3-rhamnosyl/mannosyltransferase
MGLGVDTQFRPRSRGETEATLARHGLRHQGYLLSVGSAEPRKNLEGLLEACRALPRQLLEAYPLVLAGGEGWHNERLRERIAAGSAEGWLRPLGYVADGDLPLLYAGARGFIFVSFYEGFGLPVLEAMASGVPVLGSSSGAVGEVLGGAGLLVDPTDHEGIAMGMQRLLDDQAWAEEAARQGRQRAGEFTWQRCARETANLYRDVLR